MRCTREISGDRPNMQPDHTLWYYYRIMKPTTAAIPEETSVLNEHDRIRAITFRLAMANSKGALEIILGEVVSQYTLADLQMIGGRLYAEVVNLPSPYREQVRPYFVEQLFGAHHALIRNYHEGAFLSMSAPISDRETFLKFCAMIPEGCFAWDERAERTRFRYSPKHRLFYYLMAAFTMFVLDRPGHPVGMPFPGGFAVENRQGPYYCLIRDREKDVFFSICNFCPAKQTEENAPKEVNR